MYDHCLVRNLCLYRLVALLSASSLDNSSTVLQDAIPQEGEARKSLPAISKTTANACA